MSRPSFAVPDWATDETFLSGSENGLTTREAPSAGVRAQGQLPNQRVAAATFNYLHGGQTDWLRHVVDQADALMLRNWSRRNGTTGGYIVLYRKADGMIYSFDHRDAAGSFAARGARFFPGHYVATDDDAAVNPQDGLTITNATGGLLLTAGAVSPAGIMLIGGEAAAGTKELRRSVDGTTWTEEETTEGASILRSLHWCEAASVFVAAFSGGDIHTSPDGDTGTWTERTKPNSNARGAIASSPDRIIIADVGTGDANYVYADTADLATWSAADVNGAAASIVNFVWSEYHAKWFAFGATGSVFSSATGAPGSWTGVTGHSVGTLVSARAFGRYLLAFGSTGLIQISSNGAASLWKNLTQIAEPPNGEANQNYGSVFVGDGIVVVGWGESYPTGTDGTDEAVVLMTLSAEGFL